MNSQIKGIIINNFGRNPLIGYSFYNAENRLDDIRRYHNTLADRTDSNMLRRETTIDEDAGKSVTAPVIDNITWDDLEMDKVFLHINHTNSFIGEQVLFHKLHVPDKGLNPDLAVSQERIIEFFDRNLDKRVETEGRISSIGKNKEAYHLIQFLFNSEIWKIGKTYIYHILQAILVACIIGAAVTRSPIWVAGLIAICLTNLFIYTISKMKYEIMFNSLADFKKIYDAAKWLSLKYRDNAAFDEPISKVGMALHNLKKMSVVIISMNHRRKNAMSGEIFAILFEYIWGILLIDISMFNYVMNVIGNKLEDVMTLLNFIGEIDSDIAILSYRYSIDKWCKPEFNAVDIEITSVIHPLITHPTANDFTLSKRAIITGANASGKSTFMKAVAINALLGQTINTCTADTFNMKPLHIITCMSLRDDAESGESYYFREAKYLKRMLDIISSDNEVLIVIDEILKGTNTGERISASKAILEYIAETDCFALVATHDRELTENTLYNNYYFTSTMENNDLSFEYKLHEGTTLDTNAIDLLSFLEYPNIIVSKAKRYMDAYR